MARPIVTKCSFCGEDMTMNERTRVTIMWEGTDRIHDSDGRVTYMQHDQSKSAMVCRECASYLAGQLGIEAPEELDRDLNGWWFR